MIRADDVTVRDVAVVGGENGIELDRADHVRLERVSVSGFELDGIHARRSSVTISDCTIDSTGNVGQYTSLAVVNGNPAISYFAGSGGDLKYVRANDTSGTNWGTPPGWEPLRDVARLIAMVVHRARPVAPRVNYFLRRDT